MLPIRQKGDFHDLRYLNKGSWEEMSLFRR